MSHAEAERQRSEQTAAATLAALPRYHSGSGSRQHAYFTVPYERQATLLPAAVAALETLGYSVSTQRDVREGFDFCVYREGMKDVQIRVNPADTAQLLARLECHGIAFAPNGVVRGEEPGLRR